MPRGGYQEDYDFGGPGGYDEPPRASRRKPRGGNDDKYGSSRHRQGSDDDSRDRGKGKEVATRRKSKKYSESEDEEPRKKSKGKSKKKQSKKREASSDEDEDDEEMIVTKTAKFRDVDFHELGQPYLDALMKVFEVREEKVERWCHDGLIRYDNKSQMLNAEKLFKQKASDDERKEWDRFEKKYKRLMQDAIDGIKANGGHGRAQVVYTPPGTSLRRSEPECYNCEVLGRYCGHMGF